MREEKGEEEEEDKGREQEEQEMDIAELSSSVFNTSDESVMESGQEKVDRFCRFLRVIRNI